MRRYFAAFVIFIPAFNGCTQEITQKNLEKKEFLDLPIKTSVEKQSAVNLPSQSSGIPEHVIGDIPRRMNLLDKRMSYDEILSTLGLDSYKRNLQSGGTVGGIGGFSSSYEFDGNDGEKYSLSIHSGGNLDVFLYRNDVKVASWYSQSNPPWHRNLHDLFLNNFPQ